MWNEQPAGKDHPWRYMPNNAMTAHISGTTLDAQVTISPHFCCISARNSILGLQISGRVLEFVSKLWIYIVVLECAQTALETFGNHVLHYCCTTICLQKRFTAGTKDMLDRWFKHEAFPEQNYIVREGKLASQYL